MKLLSLNVSLPKSVPVGAKITRTGIFKEPVGARVRLRTMNLDGDGQADLGGHGGVYKAAYAYTTENYDYWERELGRSDFRPGQFGENFTVEGMLEDQIAIGDIFRIGGAVVEVTQPRVPCQKLAHKMGMKDFPKKFLASCRVGFYLRVVEEGEVGAGDAIERISRDPESMSVRDVCRLLYFDPANLDDAQRALRIRALSPGWRLSFEERLTKAGISFASDDQPDPAQ